MKGPDTIVTIRNNETKEERDVPQSYSEQEYDDLEDFINFIGFYYTDGNLGCDCNLHNLYHGTCAAEDDHECGDELYTVVKIKIPSHDIEWDPN